MQTLATLVFHLCSPVFLGSLQKTCEGQEEGRTEGPEEGQEPKLQEGIRMEEERGREKGQEGMREEGRGNSSHYSLLILPGHQQDHHKQIRAPHSDLLA